MKRFLLLAAFLAACGTPPEPATQTSERQRPGSELAELDATSWVKVYDPAQASNGYTLALYDRRVPILFDMNGHLVHAWPEARVKSRVRLLPDGSLLGIMSGRGIVELSWNGEQTWSYRFDDGLPHHDVIRLGSGNTLFPVLPKDSGWDVLREVDRERNVVWEWNTQEHLEAPKKLEQPNDVTHVNSVQELPPNPFYDAGDERFRPGNILFSSRNLDRVFIIDKASGEIVWEFGEKLDHQHEARMIGPGHERAGHILIFNNGYRGRYSYRQSSIVEVRPDDNTITWEYAPEGFYTRTGGVEQPLPNGNVLITSDHGKRAFEVTRDGTLVWQWVPSFRPTRPRRYAYGHSPQLAALGRPDERGVTPPDGYRHVDPALYRFAYRGARKTIRMDSRRRSVLKENDLCRRVLLPSNAAVEVTFGLDARRLRAAGLTDYSAVFGMIVESDGERVPLFAEKVEMSPDAVAVVERQRTLPLDAWAHRWVRLCVDTQEDGDGDGTRYAWWENPWISGAETADALPERSPDDLTPEEREAQLEHLKALGYVD